RWMIARWLIVRHGRRKRERKRASRPAGERTPPLHPLYRLACRKVERPRKPRANSRSSGSLKRSSSPADLRIEMDIRVGATNPAAMPDQAARGEGSAVIHGSVLAVRSPRGARAPAGPDKRPSEERRRRSKTRVDPPGARVLTLLIADPSGIPSDAETSP